MRYCYFVTKQASVFLVSLYIKIAVCQFQYLTNINQSINDVIFRLLVQGAGQCKSCLHYKDGPYCVPQCPMSKYAERNGTCRLCSDRCRENSGCSGPEPIMGPGGCTLCKHFVFDFYNQSKIASTDRSSQWKPRQCMNESYECPPGFYSYTVPLKAIERRSSASTHRVVSISAIFYWSQFRWSSYF